MKIGMQTIQKIILCILFFNLNLTLATANHIVGGEITYECTGNNKYKVFLTVYRDCGCTNCAELDNPAYLFIFDEQNTLIKTESISLPNPTIIDPPDIVCLQTLPDVCVQKAVYIKNITLPNNTETYTLVYQRYSRNATISNIEAPNETGSAYTTQIPKKADAECNNSPKFKNDPATVICAGGPIFVDQSATDADGDSLVYELCEPLIAGSDQCPQPNPNDNQCTPIQSPPYNTVNWNNGFAAQNPLGLGLLQINPQTGILSGTGPGVGQYVVAVCVTEYRNGIAINTIRRDFQFNVADCDIVLAAVQSDDISPNGEFIINECGNNTVNFINNSLGASEYSWNFGDPNTNNDVSSLKNPTYAYPDTGKYIVTLIADSDNGICRDTAVIILNLYGKLTPNFLVTPSCAGTSTQFTNTTTDQSGALSTTYQWDFGDNKTSTNANPAHAYLQGGTYTVTLTATNAYGCTETHTQTITIPNSPTANFTVQNACPNQPVQFTFVPDANNTPIQTFAWDFGDGNTSTDPNTTHTYTNAGTYNISLTVSVAGGCSDTYQTQITIFPPITPQATASKDTICEGETTQLNVTGFSGNNFTYKWAPTDAVSDKTLKNPIGSPTTTTNFKVTVTDPSGCTYNAAVKVVVNPKPTVNAGNDQSICYGEQATVTPNIGSNVVSQKWIAKNDTIQNITQLNQTLTPYTNATYILQVTDNLGCKNTDTMLVNVIPALSAGLMPDVTICQGDSVQLYAYGGSSYTWEPANTLSNSTTDTVIAFPDITTTYSVNISNECFAEPRSVTVTVLPLPQVEAGSTVTLNVGESITLQGIVEPQNATFIWTPQNFILQNPNTLNPIVTPLQTTYFVLNATSPNGCINNDSVQVIVNNIFNLIVPNAFSPNNDGTNDFFKILYAQGIKNIKTCKIYNRWGNKIFETENTQTNEVIWDGFFKNQQQEIGVYAYYIVAQTYLNTDLIFKGNITLIR